ncbi:MAG: hypothetical protein DID90_2727554907 [Candidatus Nitrotoga sp. LAW]|nr:MAG: hypothetical protein DID90_2727554907 [Candidatus Nitrotoga sp. LAW]
MQRAFVRGNIGCVVYSYMGFFSVADALDAIHVCLNARGRPDHFAAILVLSHRFRGYADVSFELRLSDRVFLFGCVRIMLVAHLVSRSDVYTVCHGVCAPVHAGDRREGWS